MYTSNILILAVLLAAAIGFIAGALILLLVNSRGKKDSASDSRNALYEEVARLWRDRNNGKLLTEVDGRILSSAQSLNEEQRRQAREAAREWSAWLGIQVPAALPPAEPPRPAPAPAPAAPLQPASAAPPAPLESAKPAAGSIVSQINDVLQEMLPASPLRDRKIQLAEEPRLGVVVWVGTSRYVGIDAVPDAEVKTAIRAAVAEWERRAAQGGLAV